MSYYQGDYARGRQLGDFLGIGRGLKRLGRNLSPVFRALGPAVSLIPGAAPFLSISRGLKRAGRAYRMTSPHGRVAQPPATATPMMIAQQLTGHTISAPNQVWVPRYQAEQLPGMRAGPKFGSRGVWVTEVADPRTGVWSTYYEGQRHTSKRKGRGAPASAQVPPEKLEPVLAAKYRRWKSRQAQNAAR